MVAAGGADHSLFVSLEIDVAPVTTVSVELPAEATGIEVEVAGLREVRQSAAGGRTRLAYRYEADVGGKIAAVGQRMLGSVMRYLIEQFFHALERRIRPADKGWRSWWSRLRRHSGGEP